MKGIPFVVKFVESVVCYLCTDRATDQEEPTCACNNGRDWLKKVDGIVST